MNLTGRTSCSLIVLAFASLAYAAVDAPFKTPYTPDSDADVLQEVPSLSDPAVAQMRLERERYSANPADLAAANRLANSYVEYSRQIGDAHYAGYAEAIIAPWMAQRTPPTLVLNLQATILQYRHQFADARVLLQRVLNVDSRNAQAWLTLATLDMVQGDYAAARKDCGQVTDHAGLDLGLPCSGNLRSYTGQARQSLAVLAQVAQGGNASPSTQAWVQGLMAESAERIGAWPLAETCYKRALQLQPRDNFLLVAYADFLLDRGRAREVLPLLADHVQSDTAFLRIALAHSVLHAAETQRDTWIMAARFEALRLRGSDYFGREQSRFALQLQHDPHEALQLAQLNWRLQRAPWDARVLLEAAAAAKEPQAAAEVLEFLQRTHLEDPIIQPLADGLRAQLRTGATT